MNEEKLNAMNSIKEILESYVEFIDYILDNTTDLKTSLIAQHKEQHWKPLLNGINKDIQEAEQC